jgi:hypothetical protein
VFNPGYVKLLDEAVPSVIREQDYYADWFNEYLTTFL